MRYGHGKEAQAITFNIKEQRMLEKTDSTLNLEKDYALKLIELSSREVKIHQRRLKSKVGKIKSHLSVEEIKDFRAQEAQGRFGPRINTVKVSGAFTISAAAKRLRLSTERRLAAHGCLPDGSRAPTSVQYQRQQAERLSRSAPARHRLNSSYGETPPTTPHTPGPTSARTVFSFRGLEPSQGAEAAPEGTEELSTISETPNPPKSPKSPKSPKTNRSVSMMTIPISRDTPDGGIGRKPRPATAVTIGPKIEKVQHPPRCKSSSGYSSHAVIEKDARDKERSQSVACAKPLTRSFSIISDGSIDGAITKGRLEERRQTLLDIEQLQTLRILDRKQDFLNRVNKWVKENPSTNQEDAQMTKLLAVLGKDSAAATASQKGTETKAEKRKRALQKRSTFHGTTSYRQRQDKPVEVQWKDLSKCRYLRISEDEIDLSGVVTLAKDQLKMYSAFRRLDEEDE